MVDRGGLENRYGSRGHRGFEPHPLRLTKSVRLLGCINRDPLRIWLTQTHIHPWQASSLTLTDARLIHLAAQGLLTLPSTPAAKEDVLEAIRRIQLLQIDTINVVARSPYLVLFSRLGSYDPAWLDELLAEGRNLSSGLTPPASFPLKFFPSSVPSYSPAYMGHIFPDGSKITVMPSTQFAMHYRRMERFARPTLRAKNLPGVGGTGKSKKSPLNTFSAAAKYWLPGGKTFNAFMISRNGSCLTGRTPRHHP